MPQPVSHDLHYFDCKERVIVDKVEEALVIDRRQLCRLDRHGGRAPWEFFDQSHLSEHPARFDVLENRFSDPYLDESLRNDIHPIGRIVDLEDMLPGDKFFGVPVIAK